MYRTTFYTYQHLFYFTMKTMLRLATLLLITTLAQTANAKGGFGLELLDAALKAVTPAGEAQQSLRAPKGPLTPDQALRLYSAQQQRPGFEGCRQHFPAQAPLPLTVVHADYRPMALCSEGFAVVYSPVSKTPLVVVERLTAEVVQDAKGLKRTDVFYADPRVPALGQAELSDYVEAPGAPAYDRGHMAPAANADTASAMAQTFALTNMVPQNPENNQGPWRKIESDTRKYASRAKGSVYVFTGPVFQPGTLTTTGRNRVWVPTHLYKLVYDEAAQRAWAFVLPNAPSPVQRPISYAEFVQVTGLRLLGAGAPL